MSPQIRNKLFKAARCITSALDEANAHDLEGLAKDLRALERYMLQWITEHEFKPPHLQ